MENNKFDFMQLITEVQEITASGLPFMEGREKLEISLQVLDTTLTVDDYGYLDGDQGKYVVIALKEYPKHFIYGSSVVTQAFEKLDEKLTTEQRQFLIAQGLTFKLSQVMSKNKKRYTKIEFFPQ